MFTVVYRDSIAVASVFDAIPANWAVIDCRALIDGPGNSQSHIDSIVAEALKELVAGNRICLACDYGHSRSNLIAALTISRASPCSLAEAVDLVKHLHRDSAIKPHLLHNLIPSTLQSSTTVFGITGGNGLIGARLANSLASAGTKVIRLSRATHGDYLRSANCLVDLITSDSLSDIVHLAHPKPYNSYSTVAESLKHLLALLEACTATGCRLHFVSSWVVFDGSDAPRATENTHPCPHSLYAQLKLTQENLIRMHCLSHGLHSVIYRLPGIYASESLEPRFLRYFADCARQRKDIVYHSFINGSAVVPLSRVDAMVPVFSAALSAGRDRGSVIHVAESAANVSIQEIATAVAGKYGINAIATPISRTTFTGTFETGLGRGTPNTGLDRDSGLAAIVRFVDSVTGQD